MMIWRSLSPRMLASVIELALERRRRAETAASFGGLAPDAGGPTLRPVADDRTPTGKGGAD
jgi:hypothetical protein